MKNDFLVRVPDGCAFFKQILFFDNYKSIEKLEQIEDDEELALNELVVYDE